MTRRDGRVPGRRGLIVAIEGPSASGKTAAARALARARGARLLAEAFDRGRGRFPLAWAGPDGLERIERRLLRRETGRWAEALRIARTGRDVVLDTATWGPLHYTRGLAELGIAPRAVALRIARADAAARASGHLGSPDRTAYLDLPRAVRRRRARRSRRHRPWAIYLRHEAVGRWERRRYLGPWGRRHGIVRVRPDPRQGPATLAARLGRVLFRPVQRGRRGGRRHRATL
ncbi:MAG: hypothetical protein QXG65_01840 [Thermoplasmata archaeon]